MTECVDGCARGWVCAWKCACTIVCACLSDRLRLEFEKEKLHVISDLEEKFKLETDKVAKLQVEIQNVRVSMEKALRAKEEELQLEVEYKELEYTLGTTNKTIADYLLEIKKLESECGNLQVCWFC